MTVLYTRWRFDNYTQDQELNLTYQNFCEKSRQNEWSSALCSLDVNKVSRIFFKKKNSGKKSTTFELLCNYQNAI